MAQISIRPYVEKKYNLGLENYEQTLFDGTTHEYEMAALEQGGKARYLTGLNPTAFELNRLSNEEREAKIEQIKEIVIRLEASLPGGSTINKDDPDWWNKVKILKPDNINFWSSPDLKIKLNNDPLVLDTTNNIFDLLKYCSLKENGFPEIAKNYDDAVSRVRSPKFYMDELEQTAQIQTQVSKLRNKAGGELDKLFSKNLSKLFYVCKVVDPNSTKYKKNTSPDVMYQNMDKYISGESVDKDKKRTAEHFIEVASLDNESLKLRALVKDATFYKYISLKNDSMIYDMTSGTAMGKNPTQVVEFLKNPLNEEILKNLLSLVEPQWNK